MIWRISFVTLLLGSLLVACGEHNKIECHVTRLKNRALSAQNIPTEIAKPEASPC